MTDGLLGLLHAAGCMWWLMLSPTLATSSILYGTQQDGDVMDEKQDMAALD